MVNIKKGNSVATVPTSAYNNFYKKIGWELVVNEMETKIDVEQTNFQPNWNHSLNISQPNNGSDDGSDTDDDIDDDDDGSWDEDDDPTKPLSEMSYNELKAYANNLGINTNRMNADAIREAIKGSK